MKRILSILGIFVLTIFSFYYTNKMIDIAKQKDPIMVEILEQKDTFIEEPVNAIIDDYYIIPGMAGTTVDVDKSYYKMKKLGEYNENLYMFINEEPELSVKENYNKFIISGNPNNNEVAIVFEVETENDKNYVASILNILQDNSVVANFFIDGKILETDISLLQNITDNGNFLGNLGYEGEYNRLTIKYTNSLIEKFVNYENNCCLVSSDKYEVLDICSKLNMYTIKGKAISSTNSYSEIKSDLTNGRIYILDINDYTLKNLSVIIKYIKYKGYEIVTVNELISEEKN